MAQPIPPPPPPGGPRGPVHGPGPQHQQGPPPGFPPTQLPIRQQSSRISDLTPMRTMDEASCFRKLTTYAAFSLRKAAPHDPRDKPTWARTEIQDERWSQDDMLKQISILNKQKGKSLADKKAELAPNQSSQVTTLLDDLIANERDRNFEWTLAQIDRKEHRKNGVKQTATMTVYFKRSPLKELNAVILHQNIERARLERLMMQQQQHRSQQQQGQQQQQRPPPPPNHGGPQGGPPPPPPPPHGFKGGPPPNGQGPAPQFFNLDQNQGKVKNHKKDHRSAKKYHSDTSSVDPYDSEYSDASFSSGSYNTSISSRSRGDKKYHKKKPRVRSYSRRREHHKDYHIDHRAISPERHHHRYSVPDVPRQIQIPGYDPVTAAYQAGKLDAETERNGLERLERERQLLEEERERTRFERERLALSQPPRPVLVDTRGPVIVERAVPLDRPLPARVGDPRAIVSYGRDDPLRRPEVLRSYTVGPSPRYPSDAYVDDLRVARDEEFFRRREQEAEEYMERRNRPNTFMERRRSEFIDRRPAERIVYANEHPFAPMRRYSRSNESWN